jgi:hypothetical protein
MGLGAYGFAQAPLSPPPLLGLPPLPGVNASATPNAAPAFPDLMPVPANATSKSPSSAKPISVPLADLPAPKPESTDNIGEPANPAVGADTSKSKVPVVADVPALIPPAANTTDERAENVIEPPPALELPVPPVANNDINSVGGLALPLATTALPEVKVEQEKPKIKTWKTTLAPAIIAPETNFNYRRNLLPSAIYRTDYAEENKHLPVAVTRQEYESLLFASVTKNDIQTIRALLNAGTDINAVDASGATALTVAREAGAQAAAQLLVARGAR